MKIALDPYMHRHLDLPGICLLTKELGYDHIELSPRADFLEWWSMPRVYPERIAAFKKALKEYNVGLATFNRCTAGPARSKTNARSPCATGRRRSKSPSKWAATR